MRERSCPLREQESARHRPQRERQLRHEAVRGAVNIPIIGVGGITCAEDVLEFLNAGASAVEVGAQNFVDPYVCPKIIEDLPKVLEKYGYKNIEEAVGRSFK